MLGYYGPFGLLVLAATVFFAVHAVRTGRVWWVFIILFFPGVGSLIYFFVEYLPYMRAGNRVRSVTRDVARRLNPTAEIRRLEDVVALSPTVNNRAELARAYLQGGRRGDALALYRECLQGIYANDPKLLYEYATALHQDGQLAEAREAFERLRKETTLTPDQLLLSARISEDARDLESAVREYAYLAGRATGEEARARYGLLLKRLGREAEAHAVFDQMLRHARVSSSLYRREEKEWLEIAQREVKSRQTT
jgi:hypothetical protein